MFQEIYRILSDVIFPILWAVYHLIT